MLAELAPNLRPALLSQCWFLLFSLLGLTVPYRWWFGSIAVPTTFRVSKRLTCR